MKPRFLDWLSRKASAFRLKLKGCCKSHDDAKECVKEEVIIEIIKPKEVIAADHEIREEKKADLGDSVPSSILDNKKPGDPLISRFADRRPYEPVGSALTGSLVSELQHPSSSIPDKKDTILVDPTVPNTALTGSLTPTREPSKSRSATKENVRFSSFIDNETQTNDIDFINLNEAEWKNTTQYYPSLKWGKVIKVVDGDTIWIAAPLTSGEGLESGCRLYKWCLRLNRINTAEKTSKNPEEKAKAAFVTNIVKNMILGKLVRVDIVHEQEKWRRLLAEVYIDGVQAEGNGSLVHCVINLNDWLVSNGYAKPYSGKGKKVW